MLLRKKIGIIIIILFQFSCLKSVQSQNNEQNQVSEDEVISNTIASYSQALGSQSGIYSGRDYQFERIDIGHVFYDTANFVNGSIVYDDILYPDVPMLYDLVRDELIIRNFNKLHFFSLTSSKVSQFTFLGKTFIRIMEDTLNGSIIQTGFYQRLYDGKIKVWAKRKKTILEYADYGNRFRRMVSEKKQWYIYKDGRYYEVEGKGSILKVLQDKKKEIQQYTRKNRIRTRNNMDAALIQIVTYYCSLTNAL
jgi:hypothetical protein